MVSLTVSLIAVFIPLLLMGGVVGRLFREFAITLSMAVIISGVLSLTLTPMMCAQFLQPRSARSPARTRCSAGASALSMPPATRICAAWTGCCVTVWPRWSAPADTGATFWLYVVIPKGFLPQQDTGLLIGVTEAAQDISFANMAERQRAVADIVARDPAVRHGGQLRRASARSIRR